MKIESSIPFQVARAYGLGSAAPKPSLARIGEAASRISVGVGSDRAVSRPMSDAAQPLVAGQVKGDLNLDRPSMPVSTGVFSMYTRAADRVEAATAIAAGRMVDVKA